MAVKIRLKRLGKIRVPQYRIVVVDSRKKRDGRVIEEIGKYHPKEDPSYIDVVSDRAQYWLGVGAQPSDAVQQILKITGDWQTFKGLPGTEGTLKVAEPKRDKTEIFNEALKDAVKAPKGDAVTKKASKKSAAAQEPKADKAEEPKADKVEEPKADKAEEPKAQGRGAEGRGAQGRTRPRSPRPRSPHRRRRRAPPRRRSRPRRSRPRTPARARPEPVIADALEHLVRGVVDHPDDVSVRDKQLRRGSILEVRVHPDDLGKVIGRNGRTATAFRTVISALAGRGGARIDFVDVDRRR